ncbi:glycosyltransferase family 4 protein [Candidatus Woesearchaeota archaeon]|nr:glycosyltransferase family 4 protein [Candidatus Woesearchaeota archaeon]
MEKKKLAIIASRLKCADSICIESEKWIDKYIALGYDVHLVCGKLGEPTALKTCIIPELDNRHAEVRGLKRILFTAVLDKAGKKATQMMLENLQNRIKQPLKKYLVQNKIELLSVENILADASNLSLALAVVDVISELGLPTISRYHHFYWDNSYFTKRGNVDKILGSLPPDARTIVHVTNTETAREKLQEKRKLRSVLIPHTFNLAKIQGIDDYNKDFRREFGIRDDQILFLQPTLIKRRKCIEKSLRLVHEINEITKKDHVLMISGPPVYSKGNYFEEIARKMKKMNVNVIFASDLISFDRHIANPKEKNGEGKDGDTKGEVKSYSIWDAYVHADIVIYPTASTSFGNPVIESIAHKKPVVVNKYPNLGEIAGKGFSLIVLDQKITPEIISDTYEILMDADKRREMVEKNFELLKTHYSTDILDDRLVEILNSFEHESFIHRITKIIPKRFPKIHIPRPYDVWKRRSSQSGLKANQPLYSTNNQKANKEESPKQEVEQDLHADLKNKKGGYKEMPKQ